MQLVDRGGGQRHAVLVFTADAELLRDVLGRLRHRIDAEALLHERGRIKGSHAAIKSGVLCAEVG